MHTITVNSCTSGSQGIFYSGNPSVPIEIMEGDTSIMANFTLWPIGSGNTRNLNVCEILDNEMVASTSKLRYRTPRMDRNCFTPFGITAAPAVSTIPTTLDLSAFEMGTTSRVFLSLGECVRDPMVDIVNSK